MQHWHIYRKWNERLFMEMTAAYRQGRMAKDPADFWYKVRAPSGVRMQLVVTKSWIVLTLLIVSFPGRTRLL